MMFPDKCEKEYDIRVDVNEEALKLASKQVTREIFKSGMAADIKRMQYDPSTGQRTRNDIKGTDSLKSVTSKSDNFDSLNGIVNYILDNKGMFKEVRSAVKDAIEQQGWHKSNRVLFRDINGVTDDIENYTNLVKTAIINNPTLADSKSDVISVMVEAFETIVDKINTILNPEGEYYDIIADASDLVKATNKLENSYNTLVGSSDQFKSVLKKKVNTLGERRRAKQVDQQGNAQVQGTQSNDAVVRKYSATVDNISDLATKVGDVANSIDFAGASDDAVDYFGTKENMVRRCDSQLNKAIEAMNSIKLDGDQDWMQATMDQVKAVYDLCATITSATDEELVSDSLVELDGACRSLVKAAKGFAPSQTYQSTGVATA
jgi:hypothetical protein